MLRVESHADLAVKVAVRVDQACSESSRGKLISRVERPTCHPVLAALLRRIHRLICCIEQCFAGTLACPIARTNADAGCDSNVAAWFGELDFTPNPFSRGLRFFCREIR